MFSVIIPAYNAAKYIEKSISSVLCQTVDDFEILVVDDGSTDDTRGIVEAIPDDRIRCIYQPNGGVSSARNTGIRSAKGDYICFLDADDLWKSNHLAVIAGLSEKYPTAYIYLTGYEIHLHDGQILQKTSPGVSTDLQCDNVFKHIWEYGYFLNTNSVACKKSVFETVGLFEVGVKNGEDDDMWYRLFSYFSAAISSEITTVYIREYSTATVTRVFVENWVFLRRVDGIMADSTIPEGRKKYLKLLMEQRKISLVRNCILNGNKGKAWSYFRQVDRTLVKSRKYIGTWIALIIPSAITLYVINRRDKSYYRS